MAVYLHMGIILDVFTQNIKLARLVRFAHPICLKIAIKALIGRLIDQSLTSVSSVTRCIVKEYGLAR